MMHVLSTQLTVLGTGYVGISREEVNVEDGEHYISLITWTCTFQSFSPYLPCKMPRSAIRRVYYLGYPR